MLKRANQGSGLVRDSESTDGEKTEPEWVLECLSATLKRGLKRQLNREKQGLVLSNGNGNSAFRGRLVPSGGEGSFN
jgi:hypothetical protein